MFSLHHVNAYEYVKDTLVLDMAPAPYENIKEYCLLKNMLNPPEKGSEGADKCSTGELTRINVNFRTGLVNSTLFSNPLNNKFVNRFDFPTINEEYRGTMIKGSFVKYSVVFVRKILLLCLWSVHVWLLQNSFGKEGHLHF